MKKILTHLIAVLVSSSTPGILMIGYFLLLAAFDTSNHSVWLEIPSIFIMVFIVSLAHTIVLGLPAYILVKKYFKFSYRISALCGCIIGLIPVAIFTWPLGRSAGSSASFDGVDTLINGVPTLAGWVSYGKAVFVFGLLGCASAIVFKFFIKKAGASL